MEELRLGDDDLAEWLLISSPVCQIDVAAAKEEELEVYLFQTARSEQCYNDTTVHTKEALFLIRT